MRNWNWLPWLLTVILCMAGPVRGDGPPEMVKPPVVRLAEPFLSPIIKIAPPFLSPVLRLAPPSLDFRRNPEIRRNEAAKRRDGQRTPKKAQKAHSGPLRGKDRQFHAHRHSR